MGWRDLYHIAEGPDHRLHSLIRSGFEQTKDKIVQRPWGDVSHLRIREKTGLPLRLVTEEVLTSRSGPKQERLIGIEVSAPAYTCYLREHGMHVPECFTENPHDYLLHCSRPDYESINSEGTGVLSWARYEYGAEDLSAFAVQKYEKGELYRLFFGTAYDDVSSVTPGRKKN